MSVKCCSGRQVASMHLSLMPLFWVSCVVLLMHNLFVFDLLCCRYGSLL